MRLGGFFATLLAALPLLPGCSFFLRRAANQAEFAVEPLSEAEFDRFAAELAAGLEDMIAREAFDTPVVVASPRVGPGSCEPREATRGFVDVLAAGLSDRTAGQVRFSDRSASLASRVSFLCDAEGRAIEFDVRDRAGGALLTTRFPYRPVRPTPRRARESPRLRLTTDAETVANVVDRAVRDGSEHVLRGESGVVAFVDRATGARFSLSEQHATRDEAGRLSCAISLRSDRRPRDARLRVIFLDESGDPAGESPTYPCRFVPDATKSLEFRAPDTRASGYICLIQRE